MPGGRSGMHDGTAVNGGPDRGGRPAAGKQGPLLGIPPVVSRVEGVDTLGEGCRVAPSVTVYRGHGALPDRGIHLGAGVQLFEGVRLVVGELHVNTAADLRIGARTIVNVYSYLSGEGGLWIGEKVLVGPHCRILSAGHEVDGDAAAIMDAGLTYGPVHIGAGAWLGAGVTVLPGVRVGTGAVVGAGSIVTRDVPDFAVAIGAPARVRRYRRAWGPPQATPRRSGWRRWLHLWR